MVTAIDGTVISLMEMDGSSMGGKNFEGGQRPSRPENMEGFQGFGEGQLPWGEGEMPSFDDFEYDGETTEIDIGSAHISVEDDGVKASGSLSDITVGSFVTVTKNAKGEVTNVLVTSGFGGRGGFGGMGGFGSFGDFGDFENFGDQEEQPTQSE